MDRIEAMTTLLAVVEAGSLSAASRNLRVPLTTVSRRISDLEAHLKTQLLNRTSRRVTLTDAAETYIQACRRILDEVDEAERVVSGEYRAPQGELTVTASMAFGRLHVVPVAAAFLKAYPDILLRLRLSDRVVSLQEEHVDLGIRIGRCRIAALSRAGSDRSGGWFAQALTISPAEAGRKRRRRSRSMTASPSPALPIPSHWEFQIGGSPASVPVRSRLQVDAAEAVVEAALAGTRASSGCFRITSPKPSRTADYRCCWKTSNHRRCPSTSSISAADCCR